MFDPAAAQASEIAAVSTHGAPAAAILLLAGPAARRDGWSAQAAIALADRYAARGRCILIDLVIEGGELHELLGADNTEGIADVFLFGASLRHVVQKPQGHGFEFAAAGAPGDTATVLEHSRWGRLLGEQEREGVTLLLYVAADSKGLEQMSRRVRNAIALARAEDLSNVGARIAEPIRIGLVTPPTAKQDVTIPPTAVGRDTQRSKEEFDAIRVPRNAAREALIADLRSRQRAALTAPPSGMQPLPDEGVVAVPTNQQQRSATQPRPRPAPALTEPTFIGFPREPVKSRRVLYWLLSLAVLAALIVGAWLVIRQRTATGAAQSPVSSTQPSEVVPAPPAAVGPATPLLYSVAIEAHQQLPLALERVKTLREEEPQLSFYIAPTVANNVMYYQVMAGPVADSASAGALLLRLLEKGHKTGAQPGEVRRANLAFLLGEYENRAAADAREKEAAELAIPSYVIEVPQAEGGSRFRVYAGAFASVAEAGVMKQLLQSVGLPDTLVQRVGKQR